MKRTPLNRFARLERKAPMPRGKQRSWNSTLPKVGEQKRREKKETDAMRHANLEAGVLCEVCRKKRAVTRHEIAAGSSRHRAVYEPLAQMDVCDDIRGCHSKIQGLPYAEQIAIKVRAIVAAVNRCVCDNGNEVVSVEDVIAELTKNNI